MFNKEGGVRVGEKYLEGVYGMINMKCKQYFING